MTALTATTAPALRLRLTRRGRRVLTTLAGLVVLVGAVALIVGGGAGAVATSEQGTADFDYVVVRGGETLWTIAERVAPRSDPRDVIAELRSLNNLSTSVVQPGQRLAIPVEYTG